MLYSKRRSLGLNIPIVRLYHITYHHWDSTLRWIGCFGLARSRRNAPSLWSLLCAPLIRSLEFGENLWIFRVGSWSRWCLSIGSCLCRVRKRRRIIHPLRDVIGTALLTIYLPIPRKMADYILIDIYFLLLLWLHVICFPCHFHLNSLILSHLQADLLTLFFWSFRATVS